MNCTLSVGFKVEFKAFDYFFYPFFIMHQFSFHLRRPRMMFNETERSIINRDECVELNQLPWLDIK